MLAVFRVYYTDALKGADEKTPAMRLGLATHVMKLDELLGVHEARKSPSEPSSKGLRSGANISKSKIESSTD
jgi:hypothetical protein